MKKLIKTVSLIAILGFYACLYMATSKPYICEGVCEKLERVHDLLRMKPSVAYASGLERDSSYSVYVYDSLQTTWNGLADTTCIYLNNEGLRHYKVAVIKYNRNTDTLAKRICP